MSSQVPRQELLEAGRKKLKDYQQKRRSMNMPPQPQTQSITMPNKRMSTSSFRWRNDKPLVIPPTITNVSSTAELTTVTSPTSFNEEAYPLPPPGIMARTAPPPPIPTTSTPPPSSSSSKRNTISGIGGGNNSSRGNNNGRSRGHERSQSTLLPPNYASEFPSTWAYASSSHIPLKPTSNNMDEALIWIQQNNRLVQENQRLKQELDQVRREKERLDEKLRYTEKRLQQQETLLLLQDSTSHHHHHEQQQQQQQQQQILPPPRKALEEER